MVAEVIHDAFWSYAHEDNDRQHGKVLELAESITNEYALNLGEELELFLDRKSLSWGEKWRSSIDVALGSAPMFIAIVTPKYVRSTECRRELVAFYNAAKSRGMEDLLLPILYLDVPALSEDSEDEVLALIARAQYIDWTKLRNKSPKSEEYLERAQEIALDLAARRDRVAKVRRSLEIVTPVETQSMLDEAIEIIESKFEAWIDSVEFDKVAGAQWSAAVAERTARLHRLKETRSPQSAFVSTILRLGNELLPIAENRCQKALTYSRLTIELDPYVQRAIKLAEQAPGQLSRLNFLRDGVNEAYLNIEPETSSHVYDMPPSLAGTGESINKAKSLLDTSMDYLGESNEIVLQWREALKLLDHDPITTLL